SSEWSEWCNLDKIKAFVPETKFYSQSKEVSVSEIEVGHKHLTCPICYHSYDTGDHIPRNLNNCCHTICEKCSVSLSKSDSRSRCPICRETFTKTIAHLSHLAIISYATKQSYQAEKESNYVFRMLENLGLTAYKSAFIENGFH